MVLYYQLKDSPPKKSGHQYWKVLMGTDSEAKYSGTLLNMQMENCS